MSDDVAARRRRGARRTITLLALVCTAPVVASYIAYYWLHPNARVNYGALVAKPAPQISGIARDGMPWRLDALHGRWVFLVVSDKACDASCERALYATRQARTIQGREQERIVRVLLQPASAAPPDNALLAQHPGLEAVRSDPAQWGLLPGNGADLSIYLVDPLGNVVLAYPADPDIKRLAKDLERLLKASRIG
jgi:hypothetical protein